VPAPGSSFVEWEIEAGESFPGYCGTTAECVMLAPSPGEDVEALAIFNTGGKPKFKLTVNKAGDGSGVVTSEPAGINCNPDCFAEYEEGTKVTLTANPASCGEYCTVPTTFKWSGGGCSGKGTCTVTMNEAKTVTATFFPEPSGPTNRRALTVTKSGTGAGAVKSKPKGISCGNTCISADASLYKETTVVLTAKAAATAGSNLEGWEGCDSSTNTGVEGTCTVKMTEARGVVAKFGGTQKAVINPQTLTLSKVDNGFDTGYGTVKATGLACEADCTTTDVAYFGGETAPPAKKAKAPAVATLTALAAPGSTFTGWSGCDSETEGKCVVAMSSAKSVEVEFAALPKNALTLTKVGYGAVKSKPKGVSCANTCSSATASLPSDTTIVLSAKAGTGSSLAGWEGCDSSTNTGLEGTCTVAMSSARNVKATFTAAIKPLVNPQALTLAKAGSGYGTVKATGLVCEAACTTTDVNYYGGVTEPKPKPAAVVTLTAISAPGSGTVAWSGCDTETEGKCVVSMSAAKEVTATFDELE
jgi:hypothetical protein